MASDLGLHCLSSTLFIKCWALMSSLAHYVMFYNINFEGWYKCLRNSSKQIVNVFRYLFVLFVVTEAFGS